MSFTIKPKTRKLNKDTTKRAKVTSSLLRLSNARRNSQLAEEKRLAREHPKTRITVKGKIRLNRAGNMRGMHVADNSEHMRKIRAMRKIYNRAMPVLQCSNCAFASSCPQYKAGYECGFLPYTNSHSINNEQDLMDAMRNLCEASMSRIHRQTMMETLTGGMPSLETSEALNIAFMQMKTLHDKMTESENAEVTIDSEDSTIIGRLFGGLENLIDHTKEAHKSPIDVAPVLQDDTQDKKLLPAPSPNDEVDMDLLREHASDELVSLTGVVKRENKKATAKDSKTISVSQIVKV